MSLKRKLPKNALISEEPKLSPEELNRRISACIIYCQLALNSLEALKFTEFYSKELKKYMNLAIPELIKREKQFYDKIYNSNHNLVYALSTEMSEIVQLLQKKSFVDVLLAGKVFKALDKDEKSIMGIINKVLR